MAIVASALLLGLLPASAASAQEDDSCPETEISIAMIDVPIEDLCDQLP